MLLLTEWAHDTLNCFLVWWFCFWFFFSFFPPRTSGLKVSVSELEYSWVFPSVLKSSVKGITFYRLLFEPSHHFLIFMDFNEITKERCVQNYSQENLKQL